MPKKRFLQTRPFLALAVVAAIWAVVPVVVKSLARISFYEFQAPANLASSHARDLQYFWSARLRSKQELIEAGRDLAHLNAAYEISIRENESLRLEIERLERLLDLPVREEFRYEIARVVRRDFSAWWQQIIIRKGKNFNIEVGAPVVYTGGVVGRVREVRAYTAIVDLIGSPAVRLAANFDGDNRPVSFQGGPSPSFATPRGRIEFVPLDITVATERPSLLVTSGLGGVFPPGLPIGRVRSLSLGPDGLFEVGEVMLDEQLAALTEVAVLMKIGDEKEETEGNPP